MERINVSGMTDEEIFKGDVVSKDGDEINARCR